MDQQRPPRLLDQVRQRIRFLHYSRRTEQAYVHWIRRFILFHEKRHPREMGAKEVSEFLNYPAGRTCQEISKCRQGIENVNTTMIYTHVLNRGGRGVKSPADSL